MVRFSRARHLDDDLLAALLRVGQRHLGQRPVERERSTGRCRRCPTARPRRARDGSAPAASSNFSCGLLPGPPDHRQHTGHDLERIRRAAALGDAGLQVGVERAAPSRCAAATVNTTSAVRAASSRPASDWPACTITGWPCGERRHHQRPAHREMLALVMQHVQLGRVEEQALRLVHARRRRPPRCPRGPAPPG